MVAFPARTTAGRTLLLSVVDQATFGGITSAIFALRSPTNSYFY